MADSVIHLDGVAKVFITDEVETLALSGICLDIRKGEYVSISGPSGCGKSTLQMQRILCTLLVVVVCAGEATSADEVFRPAVFLGIRVGRDTVAEAKRRLGPPEDAFKDRNGSYWVYYENIGPVRGRVEMIADSKSEVIRDISITLNPKLPLEKVIALFGKRYRRVRFDENLCLYTADGSKLYESPTGQYQFIVYSGIGVAILPEGSEAKMIDYLDGPIGTKTSQCVGKAPVWPGGPNWPGVDLPSRALPVVNDAPDRK